MPRLCIPAFFALILTATAPSSLGQGEASAPAAIDFNRDIRPLLSDRCFQCHGFDAQQRQAGLRLDTWEGLTGKIEGRHPVVPGKSQASELVRRTSSSDPAVRMPPQDSGLSLSPSEITLLQRWVDEGAPFAPHWAFVPPQRREPPTNHTGFVCDPIDQFILAKLEKKGLGLSPEADRETLARRASVTLTGLPPTPEELDAFLADEEIGAYERFVERLLSSPHYGERMALMWLDVARYADTNGYHHDNLRTAWPYRNWVIDAFNRNLPYDRFIIDQLAGDLLPDGTDRERIATGFCRMHNINDEGGALDAEYRVEAVADRIETIATSLMGVTFTCARCHDHKYDPFSQEDYYGLYAFFNSIEERGVYPNNGEQARAYPARLLYTPPDLALQTASLEKELVVARKKLDEASDTAVGELREWAGKLRTDREVRWASAALEEATSAAGLELVKHEDGSVLAKGKTPNQDTWTLTLQTDDTDLRLLRLEALQDQQLPKGSVGLAKNGNAVVSSITAEAISTKDPSRRESVEWAWAWADHEQPNADHDVLNLLRPDALGWALDGHQRAETRTVLLLAKKPFGFEGGSKIRVSIACKSRHPKHIVGRPRLSLAAVSSEILDEFPEVLSDWMESGPYPGKNFEEAYATKHGPGAVRTIDHQDKKLGWKHRPKLVDGQAHRLSGERRAFYFARAIKSPTPRELDLSLGSDDAIRVYLNGKEVLAKKVFRGAGPDQERLRIQVPAGESVLVVKIINNGGPAGIYFRHIRGKKAPHPLVPVALIPEDDRDSKLHRRFVDALAGNLSPTWTKHNNEVTRLEKRMAELQKSTVPVLVMKERPKPTETFVLTRGAYDAPDRKRPVGRHTPQALGGAIPKDAPKNRLGFARWLVDESHPLTARVHVNRIWQMVFGAGIVASTENFGHQSSWPSHLELLDWLATELVRTGWDQKALIRRMVTSATFRQSSATRPEAQKVDPRNRLLSWFPRRRLPGELVRDQALYVAGLLVDRIGGPSVRPYQPAGLWREVSIGGSSNTQIFKRDDGEALYRRSLYTFWKRTSPNPQMQIFDAPTREFCVVRREVTNTPLQALVLWNDEQFVEAARLLAQRTLAEEQAVDRRLERMFRRCTGRRPDEVERKVLHRTISAFLDRYRDAPKDATKLLTQGEAPLPETYDAAELAAWTMTANTILNLAATLDIS